MSHRFLPYVEYPYQKITRSDDMENTNMNVVVLRNYYFKGKPHQETYYRAYCLRCQRNVKARNRLGNMEWATKSVAVKHAQEHADAHLAEPWVPPGEIVAEVAAVDLTPTGTTCDTDKATDKKEF